MKKMSFLLAGILALASCKDNSSERAVFFDTAGMDTTVNPADNFYKYANGGWEKKTKIPDDRSGWGSFYELYDNNLKKLRIIAEETSAKNNPAKAVPNSRWAIFMQAAWTPLPSTKTGTRR
jgi:putative endopeptidase